jgi:hypothetical protein
LGQYSKLFARLQSVRSMALPARLIGKYLSSLRKLDHIIAPKAGFEAQL